MLYITRPDARPNHYEVITETTDWLRWLHHNIPPTLVAVVRRKLTSNLKHLLVGLELKADLIDGHWNRRPGHRGVLFEPYFQGLVMEFCAATFSVLEGLGSAYWLHHEGWDGADAPRVPRAQWRRSLCIVHDPDAAHGLDRVVSRVLAVRDKLHQDRVGARADIDWHALSHERAFIPASRALGIVLLGDAGLVPATTNLAVVAD